MKRNNYQTDNRIVVVSGKNWTCYIRCVLHALNSIGSYEKIMQQLSGAKNIDISSGVVVGSITEAGVMAIITQVTGHQFYVEATDVVHGNSAVSQNKIGKKISILLTGAHFSLELN